MEESRIRIALAGNPNTGKTTLFNALTGSNQFVGNWPGVTVEKKEGKLKGHEGEETVIITDLPGIYSLSPYTLEEVVARNYLVTECPDAILNIIDGTNLERNLYLTTQLTELGIPVVMAINMVDVLRKQGDQIDLDTLSRRMGCPAVEISALKGTGIDEAVALAIETAKHGRNIPHHIFSGEVEHTLAHIEEAAVHGMPADRQRWYAIKIFERDEKVLSELELDPAILSHIEEDIKETEKLLDDDAEAIIINERYNYITSILKGCFKRKNAGKLSTSEKIDRVVTNRVAALPIFAVIMFLVYYISVSTVGTFVTDFMNDGLFGEGFDLFGYHVHGVPALVEMGLTAAGTPDWLNSLILDGIVGGVGAVLGFVPQMMILFLLLSLLEDCGYMSRVAFIMDKLFRKFGLSGKSFIPLLVASGCGVPGVMATRTIEQERDRRITIMTTCFIPCGAKMPIVGLIAGALFADSWLGGAWVATLAYFIGVGAVVVSGIILKKCKLFAGKPAPFVMELPAYHAPVAGNVLRTTWERGWDFIKRAGTLIFAASVIIWTLNSLSFEGGFHYITPETGGASILALIGNALAWLFVPLGFGNWQSAVATILGLLAKEQVVGTFGTLSSMANADAALGGDATAYAVIAKEFFGNSGAAGLSFMIFNLLCAPCVAAMGAIKREMNSPRFTALAIGYMCVFAYAASFVVYRLGVLFTAPLTLANGIGGGVALLIIALAVFLMARRGADVE